jgi:L-alanine-DL-glutamate epimerase-like enolase superfamily enzyme
MANESREYVRQGFKAIKFGWGNHFGPEGEESLAAIREAIGPDTRLMLDFGCPAYLAPGWNVKDAIKVSKLLEKYDIFFLEEALRPYDVEGFAAFTRQSPINIATGESLTTVREFQSFIDRRAVDVVQPDAQQMGITQFLRVAQRSEEAGIPCIPHCPWTVMAVAAHLNVLATTVNGTMIEYPGFANFEEGSFQQTRVEAMHSKVIEKPLKLIDGYLQLPDSPGLGLGNYVTDEVLALRPDLSP